MAQMEFQYYSKALKRVTTINVILPEVHKTAEGIGNPGGTYKTLYLLHGLSGDHGSWLQKTSIARYASLYNIAVVMPDVGRSWYTDTAYGEKYFTFVTEELPAVCRGYFKGMSDKREDNFVAGLSMGGYGAMKVAMTYPENYCGCATLSGALDITRENRQRDLEEWKSLFGYNMKDFAELNGTKHDVYALVDKNHTEGKPFPKLFVWCGTEDGLIHNNRRLKAQLDILGIEHYYAESEGDHSWKWWDLHIQEVLKFFFAE